MKYYVVKYSGQFGFIKPWTAVRDSKTFSQQFLTPSIVEGIEKKLFPELLSDKGKISKIVRHKLGYVSVSVQQEQTQSRGWENKKLIKTMVRSQSILERGVLLEPVLLLAFIDEKDAQKAATQHICLCRNEDLLLPMGSVELMEEEDFDKETGFELRFEENEKSFLVGFNRFDDTKPMYGRLEITGKPVSGM
jgi:hypothetical protein